MPWKTRQFSAAAWARTAQVRTRIEELPLLVELASGTLDPLRFVNYICQDGFYLADYSRALAMLASKAPSAAGRAFWATSAGEAVAEELAMQQDLLQEPRLSAQPQPDVPSATTRAYGNFLLATTAYEPYPIGVAAVLPCYWVYADTGRGLAAKVAGSTDHPYARWVQAYADPRFLQVTNQAIELLDEAADASDDATKAAMMTVFVDATRYEELFWQSSYELEAWSR